RDADVRAAMAEREGEGGEAISPRLAGRGVLLRLVEVGKQVERAGDEHRSELARSAERLDGVGLDLDMLEVRFGARGEFLLGEGPGIRGARGDQGPPGAAQAPQHRVRILV